MRGRRVGFGAAGFWRCVAALQADGGFCLLASTRVDTRLGRWSIACFDPEEIVRVWGDRIEVGDDVVQAAPLPWLADRARRRAAPGIAGLPFSGGYAGYLGYELGRAIELGPSPHTEGAAVPDAVLGWYERVLLLDHESERVFLVDPGDEALVDRLEQLGRDEAALPGWAPRPVQRDFTPGEYGAAVERIREYIRSGDVYQVNLTQRLHAPTGDREPWLAFRALAGSNPAPFAAFLRFEGVAVASASPERFLAVADGRVETRPIKGTAPRGRDAEEDARLREGLLRSEKDLAELTMIVDLMRNDLGRVCRVGSVRVDGFPELETYASVHHLVATVTGELAEGRDAWDLLEATLPGGSITGAPKIRAMQIIDELERCRRGVYTGVIGYLGRDGRCDLNIAIRTVVFDRARMHLHGGGGVVLDSTAEGEQREAMLKLAKPLDALRLG